MTRTCSSCGAEYPEADPTRECTRPQGAMPCGGLVLPLPTAPTPTCLLCNDLNFVPLYDGTSIKCPRGHA